MISGFSPVAMQQLGEALGGGGSSSVIIDMSSVATELARLGGIATTIADAVSNPVWVAGEELCRRSALALTNEWYQDAANDADASTAAYPYRAAPYLFGAIARLHLGDTTAAYMQLQKAIEYGRAAEPEHAATAGLLAAGLALGAGLPEQAAASLRRAHQSTAGRCPQLALAVHGTVDGPTPDAFAQLLVDDPGAWLDLDAPDDLFGTRGQQIKEAFATLVEATGSATAAANDFYRRTQDFRHTDMPFLGRLYDSGSSRYFGGASTALQQYHDAGSLRYLGHFIETIKASGDLPSMMTLLTGHTVLGWLSHRTPSYHGVDERIGGVKLDVPAMTAELRRNRAYGPLGNGPILDVLVTDWFSIEQSVRYEDLPRMVGDTRGIGLYLRALRSSANFQRDRADLLKYLRGLQSVRDYERQREAEHLERYMQTPPPSLTGLQQAIRRWVELTAPSGQPSVRPFAGITLPPVPR